MSLLDITNSFLFEREVRFPDDRSIAKNPNHDCPPTTNTLGNQKLTQISLYRFKCTKKWESLSTPDTLTTTKAGMKATTTTIQRPVSVSERSLGFKRYRYSNLSQFDNLYVELAKLWLYLNPEPVCLFSDPIFVHLSPSPLSERTNFL